MNTSTIKKRTRISGRTEEISTLEEIYTSNKPEFLAIYGRRRIGKTFLIRKFFENKNCIFFNASGTKDGTLKEQLLHFKNQLSEVFYNGIDLVAPKTWDEAFALLTDTIKKHQAKKIVLFLDEIPWMATKKSRLLEALDYYWNQHWSNDTRIKLIICGSSSSWIINKIVNNKGGLHNRITKKIHLKPFTLKETKDYLFNLGIRLVNQQILLLYMVTGGVAYYLSDTKKGLSATQIIENLAFNEKGVLFDEFDNLFSSLFDDADTCIKIVKELGKHRYGMGKTELLKTLGKSSMGGSGLKKLTELEDAGFIISFTPHYHIRQGIYYRLIDEYVFFYLKWIEPIRKSLQKQALEKNYWCHIQKTPAWYSWSGYAFESVCYKHIWAIKHALSIPIGSIANAWRYIPRGENLAQGAQIDLLFDRNDDVITICEIKYTEEPFILTKEYIATLKRKLLVFKEQTRSKKQLFLAIISANGLKNNYYAENDISGLVTLDNLFEY